MNFSSKQLTTADGFTPVDKAGTHPTLEGRELFGVLDPGASGMTDMISLDNIANYHSHQTYLRDDIHIVVLNYPRFFDLMPNPEYLKAVWKQALETRFTECNGFNGTIEKEIVETPMYRDGNVLEQTANATYTRSTPAFTWNDTPTKTYAKFWEMVSNWGDFDPKFGGPLYTTLDSYKTGVVDDPSLMPGIHMIGGDILAYEMGPDKRTVIDAWWMTNFWNKTNPERVGSSNVVNAKEQAPFTLEFTNIQQVGPAIVDAAQLLLNGLRENYRDHNKIAPFITQVVADLQEAKVKGMVSTI